MNSQIASPPTDRLRHLIQRRDIDSLAQRKLHKFKPIIEAYTAASWDIQEDEGELYLLSERIYDAHHIHKIKVAVFSNILSKSSYFKSDCWTEISDSSEGKEYCVFIIQANFSDDYLHDINQGYIAKLQAQRDREQQAQSCLQLMHAITGLPWTEPQHQEKELIGLVRIWCPADQASYYPVVKRFNHELSRHCQLSNLVTNHKDALITKQKWGADNKRYYVLNVSAVMLVIKQRPQVPLLKYYQQQLTRQQHQEMSAANHLGQQLVVLSNEKLSFYVPQKQALYEPQVIQLHAIQDIPERTLHRLQGYVKPEHFRVLLDQHRLDQRIITLAMNQLNQVAIQYAYEAEKITQAQSEMVQSKKQLAHIEKKLQLILNKEHHQLREHISQVIQESEQHLQARIDRLDDRIIVKLEGTLQKFEQAVTSKLTEQQKQLSDIQEVLQESKQLLLQLHEAQQAFFAEQKLLVHQIVTKHLPEKIEAAYLDIWQDKMKAMLLNQYQQQAKSLEDILLNHFSAENIIIAEGVKVDSNQSLAQTSPNWRDSYQDMQQSVTQVQGESMAQYLTQLSSHLQQHGPQLKQTYHQMTTLQEAYHFLQQQLPVTIGDFFTQKVSSKDVDTVDLDLLITQLESLCSTDLAELFDWREITQELSQLDPSLLNSQVALQIAISEHLDQHWIQIVPTFAVRYTASLFSPEFSTNEKLNDQPLSQQERWFKQTFVHIAKETIQAFLDVSNGSRDVGALGRSDDSNWGEFIEVAAEAATELGGLVPIPGVHLVLRAALYTGKKVYQYTEENYCEQIAQFIGSSEESYLENLLAQTIDGIYARYINQFSQLTYKSAQKFINEYLVPCLLKEMVQDNLQSSILTTESKVDRLIHSTHHRIFQGKMRLTTIEQRAKLWTAEGMIWYPAVMVQTEPHQGQVIKSYYVLKERVDWSVPSAFHKAVPHERYGVRFGDSAEIDEKRYKKLSVESLSGTNEILTYSSEELLQQHLPEQVTDLVKNSQPLFRRDHDGLTGLMLLAKQETSDALLIFLTAYCRQATGLKDKLKKVVTSEQANHIKVIQLALTQTDSEDQNFLHHYVINQFVDKKCQPEAQMHFVQLFQLLAEINPKLPWHSKTNQDQKTPFGLLHNQWVKTQQASIKIGMSTYLSALCTHYATEQLKDLFELFQIFSLLPDLDFATPLKPLLFSFYELKENSYLIWYLQNLPQFMIKNAEDNTLLHMIAANNQVALFQELLLNIDWYSGIADTFSAKNQAGDTPIMLAAKSKSVDFLWAVAKLCHDNPTFNISRQQNDWGLPVIEEQLTTHTGSQKALKAILKVDAKSNPSPDKKVGRQWFNFMHNIQQTNLMAKQPQPPKLK